MLPLREGLRPVGAYGSQEGRSAPSRTPADVARWETERQRIYCRNTDRPDWLYWGHHCSQDATLQRRYGMTCDDWWRLFLAQGERCAICGGQQGKGRRLVVDHDHDSGEVTGLTHFACNRPISQRVRRYLADPPGRQLGLVVPAAKLQAIEAKDQAKRRRNRERAAERTSSVPDRTTDYHAKVAAALAATKQGA